MKVQQKMYEYNIDLCNQYILSNFKKEEILGIPSKFVRLIKGTLVNSKVGIRVDKHICQFSIVMGLDKEKHSLLCCSIQLRMQPSVMLVAIISGDKDALVETATRL